MHQLTLENIEVVLTEENGAVRVKAPGENVILHSQNIENVQFLIEENFKIVDGFYLRRIADRPEARFDPDDVHKVSLSIVLYYLYMYNFWRLQYETKRDQPLSWNEKDFEHPSTSDMIFSFYRGKYPEDWEIKCSVLMGMELEELKAYYGRRLQYYNK